MKKVYVVAKGFHSWDAAAGYGELVFLSVAPFSRTAVSNMVRQFAPGLRGSQPDDYIVVTGLSVMCSLVCALFALKHKRLNLLLFDPATEKYVKRTVMLDDLENIEQQVEQEIEAIRYPTSSGNMGRN